MYISFVNIHTYQWANPGRSWDQGMDLTQAGVNWAFGPKLSRPGDGRSTAGGILFTSPPPVAMDISRINSGGPVIWTMEMVYKSPDSSHFMAIHLVLFVSPSNNEKKNTYIYIYTHIYIYISKKTKLRKWRVTNLANCHHLVGLLWLYGN